MKCLTNVRIILPDRILDDHAILFEETIQAILPQSQLPADAELLDGQGLYAAPGLVDLHIHGYLGYDVCDADPEGLRTIAAGIAKNGVTSWCPTTMTAPVETIRRAVCEAQIPNKGAHVLGFHLEGPYINEKYCGAQSPELAIKPNSKDFDDLEQVVMMTLAPDVEGAIDYMLIQICNRCKNRLIPKTNLFRTLQMPAKS